MIKRTPPDRLTNLMNHSDPRFELLNEYFTESMRMFHYRYMWEGESPLKRMLTKRKCRKCHEKARDILCKITRDDELLQTLFLTVSAVELGHVPQFMDDQKWFLYKKTSEMTVKVMGSADSRFKLDVANKMIVETEADLQFAKIGGMYKEYLATGVIKGINDPIELKKPTHTEGAAK